MRRLRRIDQCHIVLLGAAWIIFFVLTLFARLPYAAGSLNNKSVYLTVS